MRVLQQSTGSEQDRNKIRNQRRIQETRDQVHPDKHTASSKSVKDSATLKFKQVSEAYDVLSDDRKRADYNLRQSGYATSSASSSYSNNYYNNNNNGYGSGYGHSSRNNNTGSGYSKGYGYGYGYSTPPYSSNGFAHKFGKFAHYLTTRDFLLHATFVGIILGGAIIIDKSRGLLWNLQNSGKSFEAAMDNIQKVKEDKEKK
ncbi:Chaperone protein dnaJ 72 [Heracleum sosnowskyi]|uniref:Chaperone protein dnaJ 72 n=1 Tax=Heracleum sosnowskyi TaxID=360622 RepID=A0AAD8HET4_9APIA|nr:Chaperone protein dnaJ 72 [Heracleum sosnowskyi]